jgi:hypothetical protein
MIGIGLALAVAVQKLEPAAMTYLQCDLTQVSKWVDRQEVTSSTKITTGFGFAGRPPSAVDIYSPNVTLQNVSVTDNVVRFTSDNPFYAHSIYDQIFPGALVEDASSLSVQINRLTGRAEIYFSKRYGPQDIAACNRTQPGPWCNSPPVSARASGQCHEVNRRF